MSDLAIRVEGLGKRYRLKHGERLPYHTLRDSIAAGARRLFGRSAKANRSSGVSESEEFWALKDVGFEVKKGEVLGVIGRNGAGKSTLLKILSRITDMTEGSIDIHGRVGSLLEVGTGFHPELTGRENIFLNGAILGMKQSEVRRKFDEIVAFSEIEKFLDTPVKRYSSGMYTRLAFAVAAHLEPEILVIDEVLAVGDGQFQKKCMGKMGELAGRDARTVLFVSHNMAAIRGLCGRAIRLDRGRLCEFGPTEQVVNAYFGNSFSPSTEKVWDDPATAPGDKQVRLHRVVVNARNPRMSPQDVESPMRGLPRLEAEQITVASAVSFRFEFWNLDSSRLLNLSIGFYSLDGTCLFATVSPRFIAPPGLCRASFEIPGHFLNDGAIRVGVLIVGSDGILFQLEDAATFEVNDLPRESTWFGKWPGAVRPTFPWEIDSPTQAIRIASEAG